MPIKTIRVLFSVISFCLSVTYISRLPVISPDKHFIYIDDWVQCRTTSNQYDCMHMEIFTGVYSIVALV